MENITNPLFDLGIETNPIYNELLYSWIVCRDANDGESAIKMKNEFYLPMPAAMRLNTTGVSQQYPNTNQSWRTGYTNYLPQQYNPNWHQNPAYQAYLSRAQFPDLTSFILRGLLGLALGDLPTVKLPKSMEYLKDNASMTGQSLNEYYAYLLAEVLLTGRILSILDIDIDDDGKSKIKFVPYVTESVVNWKVERTTNSSKKSPTVIAVVEHEDVATDPLKCNLKAKVKIIKKNARGEYVVEHRSKGVRTSDKTTQSLYMGKPFKGLPVKMFGPIANNFSRQASPLYTVASTSIQIYMKYADLSNSEFMSCSPTLVISGVNEEFSPKAIGSTVALILPDPDSKAYFTKTDTSALNHVLSHINDLYEQAIYAGAQLLDSSKKAAESAETARLKQTSSGATLASVVRNVAKGIEDQLKDIATWMGEKPDDVSFMPITEFMAPALTAQEQTALVESWVKNAISHETLLDNFRKAGILKEGETVEEEIERIKTELKDSPIKKALLDSLSKQVSASTSKDEDSEVESGTET